MRLYEKFTDKEAGDTKSEAINSLFGYPNTKKTDLYRELIKHPSENLWVGLSDDKLQQKLLSLSIRQ